METQLLYFIDYIIPYPGKLGAIKKFCNLNKITMEITDRTNIYRFYHKEESILKTIEFQFLLKNI